MIALLLGPAPARALSHPLDLCTREDVQSASAGAPDASARAAPEARAIAAETAHTLPAVSVEARPLPSPARRSSWPARLVDRFVDHFDLATRLRAMRRLKIVPVFDNSRITVFFGVDRRGVAGLHVQQQDPTDRAAPLLARSEPLTDPPAWRAGPRVP